jgi:uncharacterized protein (DUF362 family)
MDNNKLSRRDVLKLGARLAAGVAAGSLALETIACSPQGPASVEKTAVVSIARIRNDDIGYAVEEALDLLGGIETVAAGKERIMLKPNLVAETPRCTTKPEVIETLARLMMRAGKDVAIGEGSASGNGFNVRGGETYRTRKRELLDSMQQYIFDRLGYSELAKSLGVPLINLHSGEMVDVPVPGGLAFDTLTLHHSLQELDLLCSVPMMKTHVLATVTLGMKNLIGLYPGTAYCSVRSRVHDQAAAAGSPGVAFEIIDMVRANKLGLTVVDGSMAMEGDGPGEGPLVKMDVIVAGTNPLATDMGAADLMGIKPKQVPTFTQAHQAGMGPTSLDQVEVRGISRADARRKFAKPNLASWPDVSKVWGVRELQ